MGRSPCCDQDAGVKKGPWTPEEDKLLVDYIKDNGHGSWRRLPKLAGLNRCGKSCRLRWTNYLRPDIKRGRFTDEEEKLIIHLHSILGNKWSSIATKLPGRTDNEIKNYWNTHLRKKLLSMGIDPVTHRPRTDLNLLAGIPNLLAAAQTATCWDINALRLQADAAKYQLLQGLLRALATPPAAPSVDLMALLAATNGGVSVSQPAGVDQQGTRSAQYDGLLNLPALTSVPAATVPAMSSFSGLLSSFGAGDGLSSTELGHSGASGSNMTAAMAPPLVAAKECNDGGTSTPCEDTPASSPFEGLENLNLDDEFSSDSWKDLLEQMSWLNNPNDQQQLM
ncbi:hypothetical protein GQ55_4G364600 [Panicum hallii var. hallii]|uniref:Uncharacterized protein n=1 Tax=Panicum hallii var. hallii TaxID=1504633 RepID=A0A2T7E3W6_9POAL|nr:hypothetical protein GQ55_4G364600 [Panicum hallii var. hallii]